MYQISLDFFKIKYRDLSAYKDIYFKKHIFLEEI